MWAIILNFHQPTHASLIQNESYRQTPEKTKNNGKHEKRSYQELRFLGSFTNAIDLHK